MAAYSDKTNKNGLVQRFEFWTRLKDGTIDHASPSTLAYQVADRINAGMEKIMPLLLSYSDYIRWDDTENHTDRPIGTVNIVSGQADYTIKTDDNSLDILNINAVRALLSASGTEYVTLKRMTMDDSRALDAMSPNPSNTGIPSHFLENGNNIFLYPEPNYAATDGMKLFFQREHNYFVATDSTQETGLPKIFDELLVLHAASDWITVNRTDDPRLQNEIKLQIQRMEKDLKNFIDLRNPTKVKMTMKAPHNFR